MIQEPYQPQWAELTQSFRQRLEVLTEVLAQSSQQARQSTSPEQIALDHARALAGIQENYIGELEQALWLAEAELNLLQLRYQRLTEPVGRGKKRSENPSVDERLGEEVNFIRHCAELDKEEALMREEQGLAPLPPWVNVVCGKEGLTIKAAVELALKTIYAVDDRGVKRTQIALERLVAAKLGAGIDQYRKYRKQAGGSESSGK